MSVASCLQYVLSWRPVQVWLCCLTPAIAASVLVLLDAGSCGHDFCKGCLDTWRSQQRQQGNNRVKCPVCRGSFAESFDKLGEPGSLQPLQHNSCHACMLWCHDQLCFRCHFGMCSVWAALPGPQHLCAPQLAGNCVMVCSESSMCLAC